MDVKGTLKQLDVIENWADRQGKYDLYVNSENRFVTVGKKGFFSGIYRWWITHHNYRNCSNDVNALVTKVQQLEANLKSQGVTTETQALIQKISQKPSGGKWESVASLAQTAVLAKPPQAAHVQSTQSAKELGTMEKHVNQKYLKSKFINDLLRGKVLTLGLEVRRQFAENPPKTFPEAEERFRDILYNILSPEEHVRFNTAIWTELESRLRNKKVNLSALRERNLRMDPRAFQEQINSLIEKFGDASLKSAYSAVKKELGSQLSKELNAKIFDIVCSS